MGRQALEEIRGSASEREGEGRGGGGGWVGGGEEGGGGGGEGGPQAGGEDEGEEVRSDLEEVGGWVGGLNEVLFNLYKRVVGGRGIGRWRRTRRFE